jgi:hypothetical protein
MTDLRTAVQQALEALGKFSIGYHVDAVELNDLIATLEAALEQPGQDVPETNCGNMEPVAWLYPQGFEALKNGKCWTAYGTKQGVDCSIALFTHPPRREWRGLTEEDLEAKNELRLTRLQFARAIESALKERNA